MVANKAIGSVPFLIEDGKNGLTYSDGNVDELYNKVKFLLDNKEVRKSIAKNAYMTMFNEWNAVNAAERILHLAEELIVKTKKVFPYKNGVCSKAEIIK